MKNTLLRRGMSGYFVIPAVAGAGAEAAGAAAKVEAVAVMTSSVLSRVALII